MYVHAKDGRSKTYIGRDVNVRGRCKSRDETMLPTMLAHRRIDAKRHPDCGGLRWIAARAPRVPKKNK